MHLKKGFTLIELMVYIAIASIVLLALATFSMRLAKSRAKAEVVSEVQYNAKVIQDRVSDAVRHSEAINTGSSTFDSDPGVLSLDMADDADDPVVFSLDQDDGSFQVSIAGAGNEQLTTDSVAITNLIFEDLTSEEDVGVVRMQYTVTAGGGIADPAFSYEQSFQTTVRIPLDSDE